jgi:Spy/CpxP family protein refolding chaperone
MNRRWTFLLLIVMAAAAFAAGRLTARSPALMGPADLESYLDVGRLTRQLNLTAEQSALVRAAGNDYASRVKAACGSHCLARCQLAAALTRPEGGDAEARQLVGRMNEAAAANDTATLDHILRVRAILTPEQRARFDQGLSGCLCDRCSTGTGACCTPATAETSP